MEMKNRNIKKIMDAVNGNAAQKLSCLATTSATERVVEKSSKLLSMDQHFILDSAITSVSTSTSLSRCGKRILSSTSTPTSALVVQDEYKQKERNCVDHNKSRTTEQQRTSKSTNKEEEKKLIKTKMLIANMSQRCICTDSKIELMLTLKEVERQVMQDHEKSQAALCHLIVSGFESNENENENENKAAQFIPRDSNLDSESCLNSVEKDGNFLHDESSHEVIADDGTSKEENGKGEGEKKKVSIIFFHKNIF